MQMVSREKGKAAEAKEKRGKWPPQEGNGKDLTNRFARSEAYMQNSAGSSHAPTHQATPHTHAPRRTHPLTNERETT